MTKKQRLKFMQDYIAGILQDADELVDKMPDTWTSKQLKRWVADRFVYNMQDMTAKEIREYNHDIMSNDL